MKGDGFTGLSKTNLGLTSGLETLRSLPGGLKSPEALTDGVKTSRCRNALTRESRCPPGLPLNFCNSICPHAGSQGHKTKSDRCFSAGNSSLDRGNARVFFHRCFSQQKKDPKEREPGIVLEREARDDTARTGVGEIYNLERGNARGCCSRRCSPRDGVGNDSATRLFILCALAWLPLLHTPPRNVSRRICGLRGLLPSMFPKMQVCRRIAGRRCRRGRSQRRPVPLRNGRVFCGLGRVHTAESPGSVTDAGSQLSFSVANKCLSLAILELCRNQANCLRLSCWLRQLCRNNIGYSVDGTVQERQNLRDVDAALRQAGRCVQFLVREECSLDATSRVWYLGRPAAEPLGLVVLNLRQRHVYVGTGVRVDLTEEPTLRAWPWPRSSFGAPPTKTKEQLQNELEWCLAWIDTHQRYPSQTSDDLEEKRVAKWMHNARHKERLTALQKQVLEEHLKRFEAGNSRKPSQCEAVSSGPADEDLSIDRKRCLARVVSVGVARQCARPPGKDGSIFCCQHAKTQPQGTMLGTPEPAVEAKLASVASAVRRRSKGYRWYSRLKLWDEAKLLGKMPAHLSDEELDRCLHAIDRYFAMNPAVRNTWKLEEYRGPQSASEQCILSKYEYMGQPHRFMWFSASIFRQELKALAPNGLVEHVAEDILMDALQRTNVRAANHSVVRNYLQAFSGPQCFAQRGDRSLFALEPSVVGSRTPFSAKDFEWLYCDDEACGRARRVDVSTARCFSNKAWRADEQKSRIGHLLEKYPRLLQLFDTWSVGWAPEDVVVDSYSIQVLLSENGLREALEPESERSLWEFAADYCAARKFGCSADVAAKLDAYWNEEQGPRFTCDMLCDCTCDVQCDWAMCHSYFPLDAYRPKTPVTLSWHSEDLAGLQEILGKVQSSFVPWSRDYPVKRIILNLDRVRVDVQEVHFERDKGSAQWRCLPQPHIHDKRSGERKRKKLRDRLASGDLPTLCFIAAEEFAPLRTTKIHAQLRRAPLEAVHYVQDIMGSLILFTCTGCNIRFPAFHPKHEEEMKKLKLQVTKDCPTAVASWNLAPGPAQTLAARHSGLCAECAAETPKNLHKEGLAGVLRFGERNGQHPLAGFPATDESTLSQMRVQDLFRQASVLEAMLVALNHMQVSVCTFTSAGKSRTGLPRFRKNIISFPQHVSDLQQHISFLEGVAINDIVNVTLPHQTASQCTTRVHRARVREIHPDSFLVEVSGRSSPILVTHKQLRSRVRLPWKPADLQHALVVLRRRRGASDDYVEDLRVRRPFVVALLKALSKLGNWRPHRGVEPMHAYYSSFEWLSDSQIEEVLPEDGCPTTLVVHELDEELESSNISRSQFQNWLWEGRHDCEIAMSLLRFWSTTLRGSANDTIADYYDQLVLEYQESRSADDKASGEAALPLTFLAKTLHKYGRAPFDTLGMSEVDVVDALTVHILEEIHAVQAYVNAWRGTAMAPTMDRHLVADTLHETVEELVKPWPEIERQPVSWSEAGRFVKAFPLEFPMGMGDLTQTCLRDDFSPAEWVQHKLRYFDGRFVNSARGHRVTWAMFNTTLLHKSRDCASTFYRVSDVNVLSKAGLRDLLESREDLVRFMATFGAEIPTTPMFWKRQTTQLEWIVRQMSWSPPWVSDAAEPTDPPEKKDVRPDHARGATGRPRKRKGRRLHGRSVGLRADTIQNLPR